MDLQLTGNLTSEISDDFNLSNSNVIVAGRLKYCLDYWFHDTIDRFIFRETFSINYMF